MWKTFLLEIIKIGLKDNFAAYEYRFCILHDNPVVAGFINEACTWKYSGAIIFWGKGLMVSDGMYWRYRNGHTVCVRERGST